jgi:exonuclease III
MKILIWNIRGIGKPARVRQLKEMILQEQVEVVGIQETIK